MSRTNGRSLAVAGVVGAAFLATLVLVPGLRVGADSPWLGALVILAPTATLLAVTGFRHYGIGRAVAAAVVIAVVAGGVSCLVAVFTLVRALSGAGVQLAWAILLFLTPAVSVLALGALALRVVPSRFVPGEPSDAVQKSAPLARVNRRNDAPR
ncbi:hypothetical protein [Mycobacterium barrassiae]|uniref:hypothetical protein n=1 Tax=Mycobacterium barrassiae TaxID=319709 RepID=UPI002265C5E9|nr:hypothetical protein [Mycobacterium barrassiae]